MHRRQLLLTYFLFSLEMLGKPSAEELMKIVAVTGLAQNFAAIKSLITTGIQHGHMKMHLINILIQVIMSPLARTRLRNLRSTSTIMINTRKWQFHIKIPISHYPQT